MVSAQLTEVVTDQLAGGHYKEELGFPCFSQHVLTLAGQ
jgi:hypothetical protein